MPAKTTPDPRTGKRWPRNLRALTGPATLRAVPENNASSGETSRSVSKSVPVTELALKYRIGLTLGGLYLRLALSTSKFRVEGAEHEQKLLDEGKAGIFSFWHGNMLFPVYLRRDRDIHVLSSLSRDGEMMARFVGKFGYRTIRGSSSRGGLRALVGMKKVVDKGYFAAFTPDGPRGPIHHVEGGVVLLSKIAQVPILAAGLAASRCWTLNSWDRCKVPKPFGRVAVSIDAPFRVSENDDEEEAKAELARRMHAMDARAAAMLEEW